MCCGQELLACILSQVQEHAEEEHDRGEGEAEDGQDLEEEED